MHKCFFSVKEEHKNVIDAPEVKALKPKISIPWTQLHHQPPETSFLSPVNGVALERLTCFSHCIAMNVLL